MTRYINFCWAGI